MTLRDNSDAFLLCNYGIYFIHYCGSGDALDVFMKGLWWEI